MRASLTLATRPVMIVLVAAMVFLVIAALPAPILRHVYGYEYARGFVPFAESLFDLNTEANVPTWFASSILLIAALLLLGIGVSERALEHAYSSHWIGLGAIFTFLSIDEAAELHERSSHFVDAFVDTSGVFFFSWVLVGAVFMIVVGAFYIGFLRSLPARTRYLILAAAAIFVGGAVGMEMVAGYHASSAPDNYWMSARRVVLTHTEETLEMTGVLLFIYALLDYWRTNIGAVEFSVVAR